MKKTAKILLLLLIGLFLSGFSFKDLTAPLYENIREQALASFKGLFHKEVKIGSAGGRVLGQIILKDVEISDDLKAKMVKINFNVVKYLQKKRDIVPSITSLEIEDGFAKVIRDKKNNINLAALFIDPAAKTGSPLEFPIKAQIKIKKAKVKYIDQAGIYDHQKGKTYSFDFDVSRGIIDLRKPPQLNFNLDARQKKAGVKVEGGFNLVSQKYRVKLKADNLDAKTWGPFAIPLDLAFESGAVDLALDLVPDKLKIDASGTINGSSLAASLQLTNFARPILTSNINCKKGIIYNQPFSGEVNLNYKNDQLTIASSKINIFKGSLAAQGNFDFRSKIPKINLSIQSKNLDLNQASYKSPGLSGRTSADLTISGTLDEFAGVLKASFDNASALGQKLNNAEAAFSYKKGTTYLSRLTIASEKGHLSGSGTITANLETALSAEAEGILLSGENFTGRMQAHIDSFLGSVAFKLDQDFMSAPLRNITAMGKIKISQAQVAEQTIDYGSGEISLSKGVIDIPDFVIKKDKSTLSLYGKTGLNTKTNLKITSKDLDLKDAKIINLILPDQLKNLSGSCAIDISVSGNLESETKLASFDPFFDLAYEGKIEIKKASAAEIPIQYAKTGFSLKNRKLNIKEAEIKTKNSSIRLSLTADGEQINLSSGGHVDFKDFSPFLIQYGEFEGAGNFDLKYSGKIAEPAAVLSVDFNGFSYSRVYLGKLETKLSYSKKTLAFMDPLIAESKEDKYELAGTTDIEEKKLNLSFKIHRGTLERILKIASIVTERLAAQKGTPIGVSGFKSAALPKPFNPLYASEGGYYLKAWDQITAGIKAAKQEKLPELWKEIKGDIAAEFKIQGTYTNPLVNLNSKINNFSYKNYLFDSAQIKAVYNNNLIELENAALNKKGGSLVASGILDFEKSSDVRFKAKNMQIDIFELLLGKKEYQGKFNAEGRLSGKLSRPEVAAALYAKDLSLAGIKYKSVSAEVSFIKNKISIKNANVDDSSISGNYSIEDQTIDVLATVSREGLGLINLFTEDIYFTGGSGSGTLQITGKLPHPKIDGFLDISNAAFDFKKLDSRLVGANLKLNAENNILVFSKLSGWWVGKATKEKANLLAAAGTINLNNSSVNFSADNTRLDLDLKDTYSGEIKTENIKLSGSLDNLMLSGKLEFNDGVIYLPQQATGGGAAASLPSFLNFDVILDFNKNMYLTAGNVNTLDLTNIFLSLEFSGKDIGLKGNAANPKLSGQVDFKRGTINVFNREFELMSESEQEKYYPYDFNKRSPNYARFFQEEGTMPYLNLTGDVVVTDQSSSAAAAVSLQKKKVYIVAHIQGIPGSTDSIRQLKTTFDAFDEDQSASPPQKIKAAYSDTEIKVLLLPEYVKALIGLSGKGVESSDVVADYLGSRLQVLVFRDVERRLEKALGLESLTLQYNFGKDIRHTLGKTDYTAIQPLFGIGFVKGFFDRLFVSVKYSQFEKEDVQSDQNVSLNYEITYKLSPTLSIAYYREPLTYTGVNTDYYKVTLKSGVQF